MKKLIFLAFMIISNLSLGQVWSEDFQAEADGVTTGTGSPSGVWTSTCVGCAANVFETNDVAGNYFQAGRTGGGMNAEGVWTSPVISISGFTNVKVYIETLALLTEAGDYLRVYYRLNTGSGLGAETLFHTATNGSVTSAGISPALNGTQVQFVVRAFTDGAFDFFVFDNIAVTNTLFSRASTVWGTSGTWSAIAIGGADCACTPTQYTDVVVGGGNTVTIGAAAAGASLLINGTADVGGAGTLTYSGNFALDISKAGAVTINNGGQITSGGNLGSALTFTDDNDHAIVNNGNLSIGDITITSSFFDGSIITLAGTGATALTDDLTVTGSIIVVSTFINSSTGAFTVTGTTTLDNGGFTDGDDTSITTFVGNVTQSGGASAFNTTSVFTSGNLIFRGGINNDAGTFNAGGATFNTNSQSISGDTDISFANFVIVTGVTVTNNNTGDVSLTRVAGGITLSGTGTWTQGANSTLNYTGTSISITAFNASNAGNTVNYNSTTSAQTIRLPSSTYSILTLNNTFATSPQFTLTGNLTVTSTLNMTSGIVNLAGNTFTLGSSGATSDLNRTASTTTNWMYGGSFSRFWRAGFAVSSSAGNLFGLFPVGAATPSSYRFVAINSTANPTGTGSYTVTHTDAAGITDLSPVFNDGGTNIVRKLNAQFVGVISGVTGGTYNIGVTMTDLLAGTLGNIRLAVSNGATTVNTVGTHTAATGSAPNPFAGRTGLSVANLSNDFRITTTNSSATPLPIELISFDASLDNNTVKLSWVTNSELNNDFFTIERAFDVEKFEEVTTIKGQGTINTKTKYTSIDDSPLPGTSYYRLKQTDFDGKFTYSTLRKIEYTDIKTQFRIYPNPVVGNKFNFELTGADPDVEVRIRVVSIQGVTVFESSYKSDKSGRIETTVELNQISSGMYIVIVNTATGLRKKILIQ